MPECAQSRAESLRSLRRPTPTSSRTLTRSLLWNALCINALRILHTRGLPDLGSGWATRLLTTHSSRSFERLRLVVYSHPDHLHFGWWFTAPHDPEDIRFDTFISGDNPLPSGHVKALTGTATYEGPAAGIYVKRSSGTGSAEKGVFAASVTLTADFGGRRNHRRGGEGLHGRRVAPSAHGRWI